MFGVSFSSDSVALTYADLEKGKRWWIEIFGCKLSPNLPDVDDPLPSDVVLAFPGDDLADVWLRDRGQAQGSGLDWTSEHPVVFASNLDKAHRLLTERGAVPGQIQRGAGPPFFELTDPEGHVIEVCQAVAAQQDEHLRFKQLVPPPWDIDSIGLRPA